MLLRCKEYKVPDHMLVLGIYIYIYTRRIRFVADIYYILNEK
jgi:hypothetical protein